VLVVGPELRRIKVVFEGIEASFEPAMSKSRIYRIFIGNSATRPTCPDADGDVDVVIVSPSITRFCDGKTDRIVVFSTRHPEKDARLVPCTSEILPARQKYIGP
jgi:hypothetical protein